MIPSEPSLPPSLKHFCQDPPWRVSSDLFQRARSNCPTNFYAKIKLLPSDPECQFIRKYFCQNPPTNRGIKAIYFIHHPRHSQRFEQVVSSMENEAKSLTFQPQWREAKEPLETKALREKVYKRFETLTSPYSPFTIPWDGKPEVCNRVKVLPLWHGSTRDKSASICETGFHFFGKHPHSNGIKKSTDDGFFGSGCYFTTSARYAADVYSDKENLLLGWVVMRPPFPVVNDKPLNPFGLPQGDNSDMVRLMGKGFYDNYNAHYIPVVPAHNSPGCKDYYPCPKELNPVWDEIVVFSTEHSLCRFWIEMDVVFPGIMPKPSLNIGQLLDLTIQVADHPEIEKSYPDLYQLFKTKAARLASINRPETDTLENEDPDFYELAKNLLIKDNQINPEIAKLLVKYQSSNKSTSLPSLPPTTTTTEPENKMQNPYSNYLLMASKTVQSNKLKKIPISEFITAIQKEPTNPFLYCNLSRVLPNEDSIQLFPGSSKMTRRDLCFKAMELDPACSLAFFCLANSLATDEVIQLADSTKKDKKGLYLKAIEFDSNNFLAYHNLATVLTPNEFIQLPNGTTMNNRSLFLKVIELEPRCIYPYNCLGILLSANEVIQLSDGAKMNNKQLYLKAIELEPDDFNAYFKLADKLEPDETIKLPDGTQSTKNGLYLKIIELDPKNSLAHAGLGYALQNGQKIQLPYGGNSMTKKELFLKAIELDSKNSYSYHCLAQTLNNNWEKVRLPDNSYMTRQDLLLKVIDLNPNNSIAYQNLASIIPPGGGVYLLNKTYMSQQQLLIKGK